MVDAEQASGAVSRLYETYANRIFGYCLYRLGNRCEAEDAVQTTFLYVFRALQRSVEPENESAWLFTIAHNVCRSTRRSARRRRRIESQQDPQLLQELAPGIERDNDALLGLEDALSSIPDNQRQAIVLREWHGMPYREIAATLGLTQAAVEMLVFRARRSLASALNNANEPRTRRIASAFNAASLLSVFRSFIGGASTANLGTAAGVAVVAIGIGGAAPTRAIAVRDATLPPALSHPAAIPSGANGGAALHTPATTFASRAATRSKTPTPSVGDSTPPGSLESAATAPASRPKQPSSEPQPVATSAAVPATAAPQLRELPPIAAASPLPSVLPPLPPVSVSPSELTAPAVADVASTRAAVLQKLP